MWADRGTAGVVLLDVAVGGTDVAGSVLLDAVACDVGVLGAAVWDFIAYDILSKRIRKIRKIFGMGRMRHSTEEEIMTDGLIDWIKISIFVKRKFWTLKLLKERIN